MICVLNVVDGPANGMRCWLRRDQTLQIGRVATADFSVPSDLQMSRNHFVVEGSGESFRVRDVGSSNGTFVNSAKVKTMELCTGDRIRAGNTIFEVSFQTDGQAIPVLPTSESPSEPLVPGIEEITVLNPSAKAATRTIDSSETSLHLDDSEDGEFPEVNAPDANQADASMITDPTIAPSELAAKLQADSPKSLERLLSGADSFHGQWWKSCFAPTDQPGLYLDTFSRSKGPKPSIPDLLQLPESICELALVINSGQLNASTKALLDFTVTQGGAKPISETLYLLTRHSSVGVRAFLDRCAQQDAAICFGLPINSKDGILWIESAVEYLSYPSMFYSIVRDGGSPLLAQVIHNVSFAVFEKSQTGTWCLLMNPK